MPFCQGPSHSCSGTKRSGPLAAGVHQSKGHAPAGESGVRVQAKARRQNPESSFCIEWPRGLNRFMEGGVTFRQQYSQQILLHTSWTRAVLAIPVGIPLGFGEQSLAGGVAARRALSKCVRCFMLRRHRPVRC